MLTPQTAGSIGLGESLCGHTCPCMRRAVSKMHTCMFNMTTLSWLVIMQAQSCMSNVCESTRGNVRTKFQLSSCDKTPSDTWAQRRSGHCRRFHYFRNIFSFPFETGQTRHEAILSQWFDQITFSKLSWFKVNLVDNSASSEKSQRESL